MYRKKCYFKGVTDKSANSQGLADLPEECRPLKIKFLKYTVFYYTISSI